MPTTLKLTGLVAAPYTPLREDGSLDAASRQRSSANATVARTIACPGCRHTGSCAREATDSPRAWSAEPRRARASAYA